ncbi:MAG: sigma 54-interacting transcriptional regulator [Dehalobacterium sp.]
MNVLDLANKELLLLSGGNKLYEVCGELIKGKTQYVILKAGERISKIFLSLYLLQQNLLGYDNTLIEDLSGGEKFDTIYEEDTIEVLLQFKEKVAVVINKKNDPVGIIYDVDLIRRSVNYGLKTKNSQIDYREIVECFPQEIFLTSGEGVILYLNPASEKLCGIKASDVLGRHISKLVEEKTISASISLKVIKSKKKVNILQKVKSGKTLLTTGVPLFDKEGKLTRVLTTSQDANEINKLIEKIENELIKKDKQFTALREGMFAQQDFVFNSNKMKEIKKMINNISFTDLTVLIYGESGVGKEVVAKIIHNMSPRNCFSFVKINCGVIPENLLESELFGYEAGAFTGANKNGKVGKIELAQNGTLFLDEIGELPLLLQVKLLDFLQDREIIRVGGTKKIKVDTRIIAATNRNLEQMVQEGRFRQDLYYRLHVFPIKVPPLRERKEDIPALADLFLDKFNNRYQMNKKFAPEIFNSLTTYDWPGNVRELEHVVERAAVTGNSDEIISEKTFKFTGNLPIKKAQVICTELMPLKEARRILETQLVQQAYDLHHSTYKAAKVLKVDQSTVVRILKKSDKNDVKVN